MKKYFVGNRTIFIMSILLVGLIVIGWLLGGLSGRQGEAKIVTINPGSGRIAIAKHLQQEGIIRSWPHFVIVSIVQGKVSLSGTFTLDPTNSLTSIITTVGSSRFVERRITILEGWRKEQIADYLVAYAINKEEFLTL